MNDPLKHEPHVNDNHEVVFKNDFLSVKANKGFYYSERQGVDSIAFVLFAINTDDERRIGLVKEIKYPVDKFLIGAFSGSIDDSKYYNDLRILVIEEVLQESGFIINYENISYYNKVMVSSQMNEFCYLFGITVDKNQQTLKTTTNLSELSASIAWLTLPEVFKLEDWKAITIISKRMAESPMLIKVKTHKYSTQIQSGEEKK